MGRVAGGFAASYPTQLQKSMKAVILSVSEETYIFCRTLVISIYNFMLHSTLTDLRLFSKINRQGY